MLESLFLGIMIGLQGIKDLPCHGGVGLFMRQSSSSMSSSHSPLFVRRAIISAFFAEYRAITRPAKIALFDGRFCFATEASVFVNGIRSCIAVKVFEWS